MRLQHSHLFAPLLAAWLIAIGLLVGAAAQPASANHGARITIHAATCSPIVPAEERYSQCHDNYARLVAFQAAGAWRFTDGNGVATWKPGAGPHSIYGFYEISGGSRAYVWCMNQVTNEVLWDGYDSEDHTIEITTTAGQEVICDWYFIEVIIGQIGAPAEEQPL